MSDEVMRALGEIQRDVGEMKGMLTLHVAAFDRHVVSDEAVGTRVAQLELDAAGHKGATKLAAMIATGLGSAAGLITALLHAHFGGHK